MSIFSLLVLVLFLKTTSVYSTPSTEQPASNECDDSNTMGMQGSIAFDEIICDGDIAWGISWGPGPGALAMWNKGKLVTTVVSKGVSMLAGGGGAFADPLKDNQAGLTATNHINGGKVLWQVWCESDDELTNRKLQVDETAKYPVALIAKVDGKKPVTLWGLKANGSEYLNEDEGCKIIDSESNPGKDQLDETFMFRLQDGGDKYCISFDSSTGNLFLKMCNNKDLNQLFALERGDYHHRSYDTDLCMTATGLKEGKPLKMKNCDNSNKKQNFSGETANNISPYPLKTGLCATFDGDDTDPDEGENIVLTDCEANPSKPQFLFDPVLAYQ